MAKTVKEGYKFSESDAKAILTKLNSNLGYPKAGVDVGKGVHVSAKESVTNAHTYYLKHTDGQQFAIPSDPITDNAIIRAGFELTIQVPAKEILDPTWSDAKHEVLSSASVVSVDAAGAIK